MACVRDLGNDRSQLGGDSLSSAHVGLVVVAGVLTPRLQFGQFQRMRNGDPLLVDASPTRNPNEVPKRAPAPTRR